MRYHVRHLTEYRYAAPVMLGRHLLHLMPRHCSWQRVYAAHLTVRPSPTRQRQDRDLFGNPLTRLEMEDAHNCLYIANHMEVSVGERPWARLLAGGRTPASIDGVSWEDVAAQLSYGAARMSPEFMAAHRFQFESPYVRVKSALAEFARAQMAAGMPVVDACMALMQHIHESCTFDPAATRVGTSVIEVLEKRRGVCQDFSHLMIAALRSVGLAARYVSGYLRTDPPAGKPRLVGADASHAWVAVFIPDLLVDGGAWVEFDPTNNCLADDRHIVLAWGRDFGDVSPIRGVIAGGGQHAVHVAVTVWPEGEPMPDAPSSSGEAAAQE